MAVRISMIPADNKGNKLFIKDLRIDEKGRHFLKYKTTYNDMPFSETEIYGVDDGQNVAICGTDGTILYRFSARMLGNIDLIEDKSNVGK